MNRFGRRHAASIMMASSAVLFMVPGAKAADTSDTRVTSYDIAYNLGADGGVDVTENLAITFGGASHHGFDRYIVVGQGVSKNSHRLYPISHISVMSPTGAPTQLRDTTSGGVEYLRIGDRDRTISGSQRYVLRYHLAGVVNKQTNGTTAFYLNAVGTHWNMPIDSVHVRVTGPAAITATRCWYGEKDSKQACQSTPGEQATFSAVNVGNSRGMTIDASMPTSAFTNAEPIIKPGSAEDAFGSHDPFAPSTKRQLNWIGAITSGILMVLSGVWLAWGRRKSRDEHYVGVAPGIVPDDPKASVTTGPDADVVVRFEPPDGVKPGLMGVLMHRGAEKRDVSATIVDLAVQGHLHIRQVAQDDWQLTQNVEAPNHGLMQYEESLLNALFDGRSQVLLSELKDEFATHLNTVRGEMLGESQKLQWFKGKSTDVLGGLAFILPFLVALVLVASIFLNLNVIAFTAGLTVLAITGFRGLFREHGRTALGAALHDQARGFELYLKTAEAKQFKVEEAEEIFSRYMPYAVVFGIADKWAKVFGQVAERARVQGYQIAAPYWYSGDLPDTNMGGSINSMGSSLDAFSSTAADAMSSTPGSSGDSGFSGGGGSVGGGDSGGGGGAW